MCKHLAALIFLLASCGVFAQGQDLQLADQFFNEGELDQAAAMYEEAYTRNQTEYVYGSYLKCLLTMRDFQKAEKLVKKQMKKFPLQQEIGVDFGFVLKSAGQEEKAEAQFKSVLKGLHGDESQVTQVAGKFIHYRLEDFAIESYLIGRKESNGLNGYFFELANLYFSKGDFDKMLDEYFEAIEWNPVFLPAVENQLQAKLEGDSDGSRYLKVKNGLLRKIQKYPDQLVFLDLLLWYFIQQKDFEAAFVQARALDMQLREDGRRLMDLGEQCMVSKDYQAATKCFKFVSEKGKSSPFFVSSRVNLLKAKNNLTTENPNVSVQELNDLEKEYSQAIEELGKSNATYELIRDLARLKAFFLGNLSGAMDLLNNALETPGISQKNAAWLKLELGDLLLYDGESWDAMLLYMQVEKAFHEDPIGREAKFREARLAFYKGDFDYALFQLSVLKAATTQLFSNDAIALSLVITDNTAFDTTLDAILIYSRADLLFFQNKDSLCLLALDSLAGSFSSHPLADDAWFKKFQVYKRQQKFDLAVVVLDTILELYPNEILADDALFNMATLKEMVFKDSKSAMQLYKDLMVKYPASSFVVEARKRYRALRGDTIN